MGLYPVSLKYPEEKCLLIEESTYELQEDNCFFNYFNFIPSTGTINPACGIESRMFLFVVQCDCHSDQGQV